MIDQLIQQLQNSDPEVRRKAIMALGRSKDMAALRPLAQIVRSDPDPALQDLARKAGQYIRQQNQPPPPADPVQPSAVPPFVIERPPLVGLEDLEKQQEAGSSLTPAHTRTYNVSERDEEEARDHIDTALTLNMQGDNAKAMKYLTEGLKLNPNLVSDTFFANVAAAVTGLTGDAAVQMIIDQDKREHFSQSVEQKEKNRRRQKHMSEAEQSTWTDVWWELAIYSLIAIIGPVLAMLVIVEMARNLINSIPPSSAAVSAQIQQTSAAFANISFLSLLPLGIASGIIGVLSLLLQTVLIHQLAQMLGGSGTWRHLVQALIGFYNKWFPILFFVLYITTAVAFASYFSLVLACFGLALILLSLYVSFQTAAKVGEAYDFGPAKGCLTLIGSSVVILILNVVLSFALVQLFGLALNQAL